MQGWLPRSSRLLRPSELQECLHWALPRLPVQRAPWVLHQVSTCIARGDAAKIVAAAALRTPHPQVPCSLPPAPSPAGDSRERAQPEPAPLDHERLLGIALAIRQAAGTANLLLLQSVAAETLASKLCSPQRVRPHGGAAAEALTEAERAHLMRQLMAPLDEGLRRAGVNFLQAACDDAEHAKLLSLAGFEPLADLWLMSLPRAAFAQALASDSPAEPRYGGRAAWITLADAGAAGRATFAALAAETFIDTQDCPRLGQWRTPEEIVRGYSEAPAFNPALTRLLCVDDRWAGCLVLGCHQASGDAGTALELTYLGLIPAFRRRGIARELLAEAVRVARELDAERMVLAVDQENRPAIASYQRAGWRLDGRESVWARRIAP